MRQIALTLLIMMAALPAMGETEPEAEDSLRILLSKFRQRDCDQFRYNAEQLIPRYYREGKRDSIEMILSYVEQQCGTRLLAPARDLLNIADGIVPTNACDIVMYDALVMQVWNRGSDDFLSWVRYRRGQIVPPPDSSETYATFIHSLAEDLASQADSNTLTFAFTQYYGGKHGVILDMLRERRLVGTCLQDRYDREAVEVQREFSQNRTHWGLGAGTWMPQHNAAILGNKIDILGQFGFRFNRVGLDCSAAIRLMNTKYLYRVRYEGRIQETNHFVGLFLGLGPVLTVVQGSQYNLELFTEVGYDGFEAFSTDTDNDRDGESINSYDVTFGLTQRLFLDRLSGHYLALQFRYNIVAYFTHGGSDLSGNTISLDLLFGFMGNKEATQRAKRMKLE